MEHIVSALLAAGGQLYLRPVGLVGGQTGLQGGLRLAGTGPGFMMVEAIARYQQQIARALMPVQMCRAQFGAAAEQLLERMTAPRPALAGLSLDQPRIMAIINVTPDSFSDGGQRFDSAQAIADGLAMWAAGADILDVGGESTRPGAQPVPIEEELRRVVPVVRALVAAGAIVSVDSRRAIVMQAALAAGAQILNDITALTDSHQSMDVAAATTAPIILMHMQGAPQTMQNNPSYHDVALDVYDYLAQRVAACEAAGILRHRLVLDPGIGFGKTVAHNLRLLAHTGLLHGLGCPILIGVSRKRFIAALSRDESPADRVAGSLAVGLDSLYQGAQILRVHDVAETRQAVRLWRAVTSVIQDEMSA